jgi:hypothetical protein
VTFTWDPDKAAANLTKHGVDFREAATVLDDPLSTTFPDEEHSLSERRFVMVGRSARGRVLVVVHTDEGAKSESSALGWRPEASRSSMKKTDQPQDDVRVPEILTPTFPEILAH